MFDLTIKIPAPSTKYLTDNHFQTGPLLDGTQSWVKRLIHHDVSNTDIYVVILGDELHFAYAAPGESALAIQDNVEVYALDSTHFTILCATAATALGMQAIFQDYLMKLTEFNFHAACNAVASTTLFAQAVVNH